MLSSLLLDDPVKRIEANLLTCLHCGNKWISAIIPKRCSRCRSKNWQRPPRYTGNTSKINERFLPQRTTAERKAAKYDPFRQQNQDEKKRLDIIRAMFPPKPGQTIACLYYPELAGRTLYEKEVKA